MELLTVIVEMIIAHPPKIADDFDKIKTGYGEDLREFKSAVVKRLEDHKGIGFVTGLYDDQVRLGVYELFQIEEGLSGLALLICPLPNVAIEAHTRIQQELVRIRSGQDFLLRLRQCGCFDDYPLV